MANIISNIKINNTEHGIRAGYMYYGTTTGTESALTVNILDDNGNKINIPTLVKSMTFALTFHVVPTTSATLSVNGLTGKPIHYDNGLTGKEWVIGETYVFIYNGVAFVAISSYDDYTLTVTGSGNAITSISKTGRSITATKGSTFLTAHPTISKSTDTTSAQTVAHSGTFTVIDSITRDGNGHVTKVNTKTITLPSSSTNTYSYINHIGLISGQWNIDELDQTNSRTYAIWELMPDTNNLGIFNLEAPLNFEHYLLIRNGFGDNLEIVIALDGDFDNADIYADIDTSNSIEVPQNSAVEICYFASLDKTGKKYVTITKSAPLSNSPQLY